MFADISAFPLQTLRGRSRRNDPVAMLPYLSTATEKARETFS